MAGKTEWEDILMKHGILEAPPKQPSIEEVEEVAREAAELVKQEEMENKTLEELDELEDDLDEEILAQFRQARMSELQAQAEKEKFGVVSQISKPDFVLEVTEASKESWVICHLFKDGIPACQLINKHLEALARKFKDVKFVKIIGDLCIPNYPDAAMPTLVFYKDGKMVLQRAGIDSMGGKNVTCDELEWMMAALGAVQTDLQEDPALRRMKMTRAAKHSVKGMDDEDFENDD